MKMGSIKKAGLLFSAAGLLLMSLSCGGGEEGTPITVFPTDTTPPVISAVTANGITDTSATITWTTDELATSRVDHGPDTNYTGTPVSSSSPTTSHRLALTGLSPVTTYYFQVRSTDGLSNEAINGPYNFVTTATPSGVDPLFSDQWHLENTGQNGATFGEDVNVVPVWAAGYKGSGVRIAIVDDGLEIAHEDLSANVPAGLSWDYLGLDNDPTGGEHGTAVAGVAAARDLNGLGVRGAAPRANMVGYNFLQDPTSANEADAMIRDAVNVHISSNSWGPPDGTGLLYPAASTWISAIDTGLNTGRGGLGTIYTWAAGNGAPTDNSNYDGNVNNRGVMAIAALADDGTKSSYSERGANLWVSTYAGEFCDTHTITTTDRTDSLGYNDGLGTDYTDANYSRCFGGTSSAAPLASGVIALVLEANSSLGWRDVRLILAETARMNDPSDSDWITTAAGYNINHNYGFGVIDADAAVTRAQTWTNVGTEVTYTTTLSSPGLAIPDNNPTGVSDTITVSGSGVSSIEFIEITFSAADHTYFGALEITLTNETTDTVSTLAENHVCFDTTGSQITCAPSYSGWVFGSVRHLGEAANGNWTLKVADLDAFGDTGTFQFWTVTFYGS